MKKIDAVKHELNPMSLMALVLSFMSLAIVTSLIFIPKTERVYTLFLGLDTFICLLFWCQLLTDFVRSNEKWDYLKRHWPDFIASIPVIEALRYARLVQIFRVIRLLRSSHQIISRIRSNRREATIATIFLLLTVLVTVGSAMMLMLEGNAPDSNIQSAGDALWWVFVTISTVGYGDHYPVTTFGKMLAAVIIICGVGLFGMVAGLVSSMISDPAKQKELDARRHEEEWQQMLTTQQQLLERLAHLEQRLADSQEKAKLTQE
ncbi:potassium channel family protein [Photobacterium sp. SDRW27]|uniref:potassium channel family protein n=1 Tax=Photobacterium obscurum TaxID=2829490 RepID=UPI0022438026|nr:potassium channel family protein [Photobacterium obscurum]MCW8330351.1 potassium channel family protein [Photobacterium obscurum]